MWLAKTWDYVEADGTKESNTSFPISSFSENYGEPVEVKIRVTRFEKGHSTRCEHGKKDRTCVR